MKAAWIETFGGPEVIWVGDRPIPPRRAGEVLVRMASTTLNHHDIYLRRGEIGRVSLPVVLGSDGVGHVVDADRGSPFVPGQPVVVYPVLACGGCISCQSGAPHECIRFGMIGGERDGTQAEYLTVPEACLVDLPASLDVDMAAAISLAGLTAWTMVIDKGQAIAGEHALVLGASGGVGVFVVRLLKRLGLIVHAVTSKPDKTEALLALGADFVVADSPIDVLRHTKGLPNGGVDIAFNWVGGNTWRYVPAAVRAGGRILVCGTVRSPSAELDMRQIFYRSLRLIGSSMGTPEALRQFLKLAAEDPQFRVPIHQTITLDQVADAHRWLEANAVVGKVVVRP